MYTKLKGRDIICAVSWGVALPSVEDFGEAL